MASRASTRTLCASREGASEQGLSSLAAYRAQTRSFAQDFHSLQLAVASSLQQQAILGSTAACFWSLTRIREGHASGHHASTTSGCETWSNEDRDARPQTAYAVRTRMSPTNCGQDANQYLHQGTKSPNPNANLGQVAQITAGAGNAGAHHWIGACL